MQQHIIETHCFDCASYFVQVWSTTCYSFRLSGASCVDRVRAFLPHPRLSLLPSCLGWPLVAVLR